MTFLDDLEFKFIIIPVIGVYNKVCVCREWGGLLIEMDMLHISVIQV